MINVPDCVDTVTDNVKFYYMRDNITFIPLHGKTMNEIVGEANNIAELEDHRGALCIVIPSPDGWYSIFKV